MRESVPSSKWEVPLAERMRPRILEEMAGQRHLISRGAPLYRAVQSGHVPSCILYGPPGVGKTSIARLMATMTERDFLEINAVSANVAALRDLVAEAKHLKNISGRTPVAFVDEIYHFNRQQQNALLPSVEKGDLILMGTTTENPSFEINKTLLSRAVVYELRPIETEDMVGLLERALSDIERGLGELELSASRETLTEIALGAGGDARQALTRLELSAHAVATGGGSVIDIETVRRISPKALQRYDRDEDDHYRIISALIKSMRGSDPDAAVYWLGRLVAGGEDIRFVARRLLVFAAEDVGLADPRALSVAASAAYAADFVGLPEARIILSEAVIYLSLAPKSNSAYMAVDRALSAIEGGDLQEVPPHLRPGGKGYIYPHDLPGHWVAQRYMEHPRTFYRPGSMGAEPEMVRLHELKRDGHYSGEYEDDTSGKAWGQPLPEEEGGEEGRKEGPDGSDADHHVDGS
ncbi:MAG TPA: replication-associated recombination protein A [Synergistales bacterium]|nr:replication-associated recombination protein A [Synergistales bacterium]HPE91719.1 replication-associated recombination protein A [Synergistales bacterium]